VSIEVIDLKSLYQIRRNAPRCLDLFCGAGGLSLGFAMAGGRPIGAVDFDSDSVSTFRKNFPRARDVQCCPIEEWTPKSSTDRVNVVIGGPPCQGFSLARGTRFVDDPRNHLYKYFLNTVTTLRPTWFVMENVEGITNIGGGAILQQILDDFAAIDYRVKYRVVNMARYGVPQSRKRAIFVGTNTDKVFDWPQECYYDPKKAAPPANLFGDTQHPFLAVNDALSDMLFPQGNFFSHRANSQMRGPRNRCAHTQPAFTLRVRGDEFAICEEPASSAFIPGPPPREEAKYRAPQNELQEMLRFSAPSWVKRETDTSNRRKKPRILGMTK
jgi:DNA-cytosine methyltransferase